MKRLFRRIVLCLAALTPSVASLTLQEVAASLAVMLIGITGVISLAVAAIAVSPKVNQTLANLESPKTEYPSLLTLAALTSLQEQDLDPVHIRVHLQALIGPMHGTQGFITPNDELAMIIAQVMAQWRVQDAMQLSDDQARELWLIERLMQSTPAKAGALAAHFTSPNAMLAMRDRVAENAA